VQNEHGSPFSDVSKQVSWLLLYASHVVALAASWYVSWYSQANTLGGMPFVWDSGAQTVPTAALVQNEHLSPFSVAFKHASSFLEYVSQVSPAATAAAASKRVARIIVSQYSLSQSSMQIFDQH
jgi:hypothetical protein